MSKIVQIYNFSKLIYFIPINRHPFPRSSSLQTQLGHLRDAYGKTLTILGAAPAAPAASAASAASAALLEPMAPEVGMP